MWHCAHAVTFPAGAIWCEFVSGKPGGAVIESRAGPRSRVVARRALRCGESCRHVIRYASAQRLRARPCRLVASVAVRIRRSKRVVVVDVAQRAGRRHVGAGQRESRRAVVKRRCGPAHRRMAVRAVRGGECCARGGVHWDCSFAATSSGGIPNCRNSSAQSANCNCC